MTDNQLKTVSNLDPVLEINPMQKTSISLGNRFVATSVIPDEYRRILVKGKQAGTSRPKISLTQSLLTDGDRRTEINDPSLMPWQMICLLKIRCKDGIDHIGTGWIAGPRLIITAGHCLYHDGILSGWADHIEVLPGHIDGASGKTYISARMETTTEWLYKGDENFDIGAIFLSEDIENLYGSFSVGSYPDQFFQDRLVNISGYPATRYGDIQLHHENRVNSVTRTKLYYDVDTEGGQSGSPIWIYEDDNLENPVVVGVHSYGAGNSQIGNSGVRINSKIYELITKWKTD